MHERTADFDQVKSKLTSSFKNLAAEGEELLKATAQYSGENLTQARAKFQDGLSGVKTALNDIQMLAIDKYKEAASATDEYVHENPWKAVGIAAAAGLLIGLLAISKR